MPVLANNHVVGSGELTSTSETLVDALCSSPALANGVSFFVVGLANHRNEGNNYASEIEARFGTTRLCFDRFRSPFGNFNLGDDGAGSAPLFLAVVTGDGSSTLNMRARAVDSGGGANIIVGSQAWTYFSLEYLVDGTDYAYEQLNSETESARPTTDTWIEGDAAGQLRITPAVTGDYWISASIEAVVDTGAAATNEARVRLRLIEDPDGAATSTTIGFGEQYHAINDSFDTDHYAPILGEMDVRTLTGGTTYEIRWEASNASAHDEIAYRRERVYAFRLGRFRNASYITNGGGMESTGSEAAATNALTFDWSATGGDVLVFGSAGYQNDGTWGDTAIRREGAPDADFPGSAGAGRFHAAVDTQYTDGDIVAMQQAARVAAVAGSETFRLVAWADGPDGLTYGRTRGNGGDGRALVLALEMYVGEVFELEGDVTGAAAFSVDGGAVSALFGDVGAAAAFEVAGGLAFGLAGDVTGAAAFAVDGQPVVELDADAAGAAAFSVNGQAVVELGGDAVGAAAFAVDGQPVVELGADAVGAAATAVDGGVAFGLEADAVGAAAFAVDGDMGSATQVLVGGAGQQVTMQVLGADQYGILRPRVGDDRPVRFELLDVSGTAIDHALIESATVQIRRASEPISTTVELEPEEDTETGSDDEVYTWTVDLSEVITVGGSWALEVDVEFIDGLRVTWPSAGPLRIQATEGVG